MNIIITLIKILYPYITTEIKIIQYILAKLETIRPGIRISGYRAECHTAIKWVF